MRLLFVLAICPSFAVAQDNAEVALVKATLNELQVVSIAQNVEYCGYIGFDAHDNLIVTPPTRGDEGSCLADDPDALEIITASYRVVIDAAESASARTALKEHAEHGGD